MARRNPQSKASGDKPPDDVEFDAANALAAYGEYSKTLRTWLVAFGVGGPALILVNARISAALLAAGCLRQVALAFLIGVATQVLNAFINKMANWAVYRGTFSDPGNWFSAIGDWIVDQFWIDVFWTLSQLAASDTRHGCS
jgi:hypothetical protein